MNADANSRRGRSALALFAGFVVTVVLTIALDLIMHATGVFPPWGQPMRDALFGVATAYRVVITVLGGFITARLAPRSPMGHAMVGGAIGVVLASIGLVATWDRGPEFGPKWYPIALVITAIPCMWAGAMLQRFRATGRYESVR